VAVISMGKVMAGNSAKQHFLLSFTLNALSHIINKATYITGNYIPLIMILVGTFVSKIINCGRFQVLTAELLSIQVFEICFVTGQVLLDLLKDQDCLTPKTRHYRHSKCQEVLTQQHNNATSQKS
jgi:hypothetical protein